MTQMRYGIVPKIVQDKHAPIRQRRVEGEYKHIKPNQIKQMSYYRDYLKK